MTASDLAFATIAEVAPRIEAGEISPVELTELALDRITQRNTQLNAYITVMADTARQASERAAAAIKAGQYLGPLHGIPVAVKDLFATSGVRTTFGSPLFADWVPNYDAAVVERLNAAGAIVLGKTNLHELAYGTTSSNAHYGAVRNPWHLECHPGGSSGGSGAAVADGLAMAALGSDTGASIRQPAACCGLVGLKPTFGRVSKFGALSLSWSMDHVGPMTRSVEDAALMLQVLAGHDARDPTCMRRSIPDYRESLTKTIRGCKLGVARQFFFEDCDPEVEAAVENAVHVLRDLGAIIVDVELPDMWVCHRMGSLIIAVEGAAYHADALRTRPEKFSDEMRTSFGLGNFYTGVQYVQAQRLRRHLTVETQKRFESFDALITPTSPVPTTRIADDPPGHALLRSRNTLPFNFTSLPAISVPCGFTSAGLPVGLQIAGKAFDEAGMLQIAYAYEQATSWHQKHPPQ
ncbi:MAG: Asp-tRNA(Asn)/Glu-tRNA(Gln) amidotransferase subunit GatA [Proteobacteria bacterium]|nr:Asp-tRNA(Asn)/Glu-tRNA(Gln) amidotransferase subunit GatA [Pseudomonadota bacterium]